MSQRIVATAGTGAITDDNQVAFTLHAKHFKYGKPVVSVEGLAGAETLSWYIWTNGDWEEVSTADATQIIFTATYASDVFNGPGQYGFIKDVTAGAITVTVDDGR